MFCLQIDASLQGLHLALKFLLQILEDFEDMQALF